MIGLLLFDDAAVQTFKIPVRTREVDLPTENARDTVRKATAALPHRWVRYVRLIQRRGATVWLRGHPA
jgi:hypothetical protein